MGLLLEDKQHALDINSSADVRPAVIKSLTVSRSLCFTAVCSGYHDLHAARRHMPADGYLDLNGQHCGLQKKVLFDLTVWKPFCLAQLTQHRRRRRNRKYSQKLAKPEKPWQVYSRKGSTCFRASALQGPGLIRFRADAL